MPVFWQIRFEGHTFWVQRGNLCTCHLVSLLNMSFEFFLTSDFVVGWVWDFWWIGCNICIMIINNTIFPQIIMIFKQISLMSKKYSHSCSSFTNENSILHFIQTGCTYLHFLFLWHYTKMQSKTEIYIFAVPQNTALMQITHSRNGLY